MRRIIFTLGTILAAAVASPSDKPVPTPTAAQVHAIDTALVGCGTRQSMSSWTNPERGIGCARDAIKALFEEAAAKTSRAEVVVDRFEATGPRTGNKPVPMENVYLVSQGSDPTLAKTAFLVSGHFDSICSDIMDSTCDAPGADDDASGSTVSIMAATLLEGRPHRATLIFAAVSGEEQGLYGGKRLEEWTKAHGYMVGGMLNNDIVGATNGSTDRRPRVFADDEEFAPARELGLWIDEFLGRDAVRLVFRKDRFGRGGDHLPFVEAGDPAVRFCEPKEDYRHQHQTPRTEAGVEYGDLQKFMDFEFLAVVARDNAEALIRLANAPAPPTSVIVEGAVRPSATLTIEAGDDADRASFEILARETTESRWRLLQTVDRPGAVALENEPIDNEFFAVRSVGKNGERSIAVDAKPVVKRPAGLPPAK